MAEFKNIPLKSISVDPNQPRKFFDENALQELTDSVRVNDVIQPIMVRPNGKDKYKLVMGERRYVASMRVMAAYKTRNTIPAVIRELTDEQALELQIIENLQRKDVHPMEEAVAFKSLLDHKQFSVLEIAARVGKSEFYVRQRLKLNELTKEWKEAFFANSIKLRGAIQVCQLPVKAQESLYKDNEHRIMIPGVKFEIDNWTIDRYKGELHKASFDFTDATLDKKVGACTGCQYNTSVSLLFPDHAKSPRCMNIACFNKKSESFLQREIQVAIEDPAIILVNNTYNSSNDLLKKLKSEGQIVMKAYDDFTEVSAPVLPDMQELKDQYEDEIHEGDKSLDEVQKEFEELQAQYDKELEAYNKKIATGKYKKALVVCGSRDEMGKYIYVALKEKGQTKTAKAAIESGSEDVTPADIDQEITRLQEREKRNKELDAEKVHAIIKETITKSKAFAGATGELQQVEIVASAVALWEAGSMSYRKDVIEAYGMKNGKEIFSVYGSPASLVKEFSGLTIFGLNEMLRMFMLDKLISNGGSRLTSGDALAIHNLALQYEPDDINKALLEQEEIAIKREKKVNQRIAELEEKKKELQLEKATKKGKVPKTEKITPLQKGISSLLTESLKARD